MMSLGTVLYVGGFELPDGNAAAHRVLSNAKLLRDVGYNVILIGVSKIPNSVFLRETEVDKFQCEQYDYPSSLLAWIRYSTSIEWLKKRIFRHKNVKMIILYNYPAFALNELRKLAQKKGIKIWSDCTEWYPFGKGNVLWSAIKWIDTEFRMRVVNKKIDGVLVISTYLQEYYKKSNTILLPPLVDKCDIKWDRNTRLGHSNIVSLVYAGSPFGKDQLQALINVVQRFKGNIQLDVVGITLKEYIDNYTIANNEPNLQHVFFHGRVPHSVALDFIKNADASVFFRRACRQNNAGFPTKFVESISCATPVITNRTSDLSGYFENSNSGVLISGLNEEEIEKGIRSFLERKEKIYIDEDLFDYRRYTVSVKKILSTVSSYEQA